MVVIVVVVIAAVLVFTAMLEHPRWQLQGLPVLGEAVGFVRRIEFFPEVDRARGGD